MSRIEDQIKSKLSIPMYMKTYIDHTIDLNSTPTICCPVHQEDTPSFSYKKERDTWRCFGACKDGGDVIKMHMWYNKIRSREEAVDQLVNLLKIERGGVDFTPPEIVLDMNLIEYAPLMNKACKLAKTVEDYLDLDFIMSQHRPIRELKDDLEMFINRRVN